MDNVGSLITPMELTDDVMNTQFYDKVDDYKTLKYNKNNCRLETYEEKIQITITYSLILKPLQMVLNMSHIYVGFITMIFRTGLYVLMLVVLWIC